MQSCLETSVTEILDTLFEQVDPPGSDVEFMAAPPRAD